MINVVVLILVLLAGDLTAQESCVIASSETNPGVLSPLSRIQEEAVRKDLYRLRIGDTLSISVYGEEETRFDATVGMSGKLNYLFIKNVEALGKTIDELRDILTEQLKSFYRYPVVIITPVAFAGEYYTIIGEVNDPGKKNLFGNTTLTSALCAASGFRTRIFRNQTVDLVNYDHSFLARNGELVPVNFKQLIVEGDIAQDVKLKAGDYIFIAPQQTSKVFVVGEVKTPVTVNYLNPITLADALAEAGGLTIRSSSRVLVIRGSIGYPRWFLIDINLILKGRALDFPLEPGDIVFVPVMKFQLLKEYVQAGILAFVNIVANVAGTNSFLEITPKAKVIGGVVSPVPVITPVTPLVSPVVVPAATVR